MSSIIDRLYIDEQGDKKIYDNLRDNEEFFKNNKENKDLFLFAMVFGFINERRLPFTGKKLGYFLEKNLKYEDHILLNVLAIHETQSLDILNDKEKIFNIAEEYAHGGLKLLNDDIESIQFGTFSKNFEMKLNELIQKNKE